MNIMNKNTNNILGNILSVIISNITSIIIGFLTIIILPKYISVLDYSLWQLYIFYLTFIGIFHLGWIDGVYLRLGGIQYSALRQSKFTQQALLIFVLQAIFSVFFIISTYYIDYNEKEFIIYAISASIIIINTKQYYITLLQSSYKLFEYAKIVMLDRILFSIILIIFICNILPISLERIIIVDLICKTLGLLYVIYLSRDILIFKKNDKNNLILYKEILINIKVGMPLLLANYASLIIIGIFRWAIEYQWGIETFGKVSLILSLSNLFLLFTSAISIVQYPLLRRIANENIPYFYKNTRTILSNTLIIILLLYFPLKILIETWLSNYSSTIEYLIILFPICVFEGKTSLLTNVYLKVIRKEKIILLINIITAIISLGISILSVFLLKNLDYAIYGILIVSVIKSSLGEFLLSRSIGINFIKSFLMEMTFIILFISSHFYIHDTQWNFIICVSLVVSYIFVNYKKTLDSVLFLLKR